MVLKTLPAPPGLIYRKVGRYGLFAYDVAGHGPHEVDWRLGNVWARNSPDQPGYPVINAQFAPGDGSGAYLLTNRKRIGKKVWWRCREFCA